MELLLTPPFALLVYFLLASALSGFGRLLAGAEKPDSVKSGVYASGEADTSLDGSAGMAVPGYQPFFRVALFFAVLHLGIIVLATGGTAAGAGVYLLGLMLALVALILG